MPNSGTAENSPYKEKLANVGLFLKALSTGRRNAQPDPAHLGNSLAAGRKHPHVRPARHAPPLDEHASLRSRASLGDGSRSSLDRPG